MLDKKVEKQIAVLLKDQLFASIICFWICFYFALSQMVMAEC